MAGKTPTRSETAGSETADGATAGGARDWRAAVIVGGNRIPFARANGPYAQASNQDMLIAALDGLVARFGMAGETVGEVAAGAGL